MPDSVLNDYALWLIPEDEHFWSNIITELSQQEAGSPVFAPHITLYHPIPSSESVGQIQAKLRSFKPAHIHLRPLRSQAGSSYHQSVLVAVEANDDLLQLRRGCEETWGSLKPYFPHLSLLYGDLAPDRRTELAGSIQGLPDVIKIREIAVARCVGTAEQWTIAATMPI